MRDAVLAGVRRRLNEAFHGMIKADVRAAYEKFDYSMIVWNWNKVNSPKASQ